MSVLMNQAQNNSRKSLQQAADAEMKALEESIQAEIRALEVLMPRLNSFVFRSSPADPRSMALSGGSFRHFSPQLFRPLFLVIPLLHKVFPTLFSSHVNPAQTRDTSDSPLCIISVTLLQHHSPKTLFAPDDRRHGALPRQSRYHFGFLPPTATICLPLHHIAQTRCPSSSRVIQTSIVRC